MPNLKQSKWEENVDKFESNFPTKEQVIIDVPVDKKGWDFTRYFEEKLIQFCKDLLAERDIEITNLEEDIEMLEDELKEKDEAWRNYYGIERDKRDAQWLSCLPEEKLVDGWDFENGAYNGYRKDFLTNAKRLKLIE